MPTKNSFCLLSILQSSTVSDDVDDIIDTLPFGEIEATRIKKIKNSISLKNSLSSLLSLRDLLVSIGIDTKAQDLSILRTSDGKPYFASLPLHFNITHSGSICAVALSDFPIGIDLELIDTSRDVTSISKRFFDSAEHSGLCNATDPYDYFFSIWTKKEAQAKLSGKGLASIFSEQINANPNLLFKEYRLADKTLTARLCICSENKNIDIKINNNTDLFISYL